LEEELAVLALVVLELAVLEDFEQVVVDLEHMLPVEDRVVVDMVVGDMAVEDMVVEDMVVGDMVVEDKVVVDMVVVDRDKEADRMVAEDKDMVVVRLVET
jgi:hypothetical protein